MSRFQFCSEEIDQALGNLYSIKYRLLEEDAKLLFQRGILYSQKGKVITSARNAIKRSETQILKQYAGTVQLISALVKVRDEVKRGEMRACGQLGSDLTLAELARLAKILAGIGLITVGPCKVLPILKIPGNGSGGWWNPVEGSGIGLALLSGGVIDAVRNGTSVDSGFLRTNGKITNNINYNKKKGTIGAELGAEGSGALWSGKVRTSLGILNSETSMDIGKIKGSGKAKAVLFKDGHFKPSLGAEASVSAEGATISHESRIGTDKFNAHGKASGTLGYAEAKAGASIGTDGVHAEAKAGAYVARGKASSGFTFFGIKVDAEVEGNFGGASAGAEFHAGNREVSLGGELGFLAGLGLKIKVSW